MPWLFIPARRFADHAEAWDALQRRSTDTPFLESLFIEPLLQEFGSGRELLAMHTSGGDLDVATLVRPAGRGMWETFQPSQLPLGPWVAPIDHDLSAHMGSLMHALPGLVLGLGVTQLDPRLVARPTETESLRLLDYIQTSYIDIEGPFEAFWEARGKNLRQNTRKQRNKLQSDGTAISFEVLTSPEQVPAAMREYGALESTGWKAGQGTAIHVDNAQGRFYIRMLQNFCAQGRGRIVRYCFGDKVVSMDLCIDNGPTVVILKTTYDESYRSVSPSTLMRQEEFEAWWNEGRYSRIEFYGKTMEWHARWTSKERALFHATSYRWAWLHGAHRQLLSLRAGRLSQTETQVHD